MSDLREYLEYVDEVEYIDEDEKTDDEDLEKTVSGPIVEPGVPLDADVGYIWNSMRRIAPRRRGGGFNGKLSDDSRADRLVKKEIRSETKEVLHLLKTEKGIHPVSISRLRDIKKLLEAHKSTATDDPPQAQGMVTLESGKQVIYVFKKGSVECYEQDNKWEKGMHMFTACTGTIPLMTVTSFGILENEYYKPTGGQNE